ncbi:MAG: hypothetical protein KAI97_07510 [Gemmatimonadetes bacterium]|nr:hypothetical protein [Gemmatimonadota bacterium]
MTTEMWIVVAGCVLICLGGIGIARRTDLHAGWHKRCQHLADLSKSAAPSLRYNPRCAACGHWSDSALTVSFGLRYDKCMRLIVTCPGCGYSWQRPLMDEERVTLLNQHLEEKEEI